MSTEGLKSKERGQEEERGDEKVSNVEKEKGGSNCIV